MAISPQSTAAGKLTREKVNFVNEAGAGEGHNSHLVKTRTSAAPIYTFTCTLERPQRPSKHSLCGWFPRRTDACANQYNTFHGIKLNTAYTASHFEKHFEKQL